MRTQRFDAAEEDGIWTDAFVDALNGVLGNDLRDRVLSAVNDAIEECFDEVDT